MTKSELILFKSKAIYFLDIIYNERYILYSDIRFCPFYNYEKYMFDRQDIINVSKIFKDQFLQFNKERYAMFKRFNNKKLKLKRNSIYKHFKKLFMF